MRTFRTRRRRAGGLGGRLALGRDYVTIVNLALLNVLKSDPVSSMVRPSAEQYGTFLSKL